MKTKFAMPTERDLRFVRHSGFKPEEFGEDFRIVTSAIDGLLIGCGRFRALPGHRDDEAKHARRIVAMMLRRERQRIPL